MSTSDLLNTNRIIRIAQDFSDDIDRTDMQNEPGQDDLIVHVYRYADGHNPNEIIVLDRDGEEPPTELDLAILYSPTKLNHKCFPLPGKSRPTPYRPTPISLIAYQGCEGEGIYHMYPNTDQDELDVALDSLQYDRLTMVNAVTGIRNEDGVIYHSCSSTTGTSGGILVNEEGEMMGIFSLGRICSDRRIAC